MRKFQKFIAFVCALALLLCAVPLSASAENTEDTADLTVSSADYTWELSATVFIESLRDLQKQCATFHPVTDESVETMRVTLLPQQLCYTVNTGSAKFNTAIEYDTDANHTAYSRVKHYINNGKAYSYSYDDAGNISKIQNPDAAPVAVRLRCTGRRGRGRALRDGIPLSRHTP